MEYENDQRGYDGMLNQHHFSLRILNTH